MKTTASSTMARMAHATTHHPSANWRIACLITLGAFLGLALAAFAAGLLPGDLPLRYQLLEEQSTVGYILAHVINRAGEWRVLLPATIALFLLSGEARRRWWLWCAVQIVAPLVEHTVKFMVGRPRPSGFALGFPSGHTTSAAAFAFIVIYLVSRSRLGPGTRYTIQALAVLLMGLVGWARIALHAHWPTDVLGGFLLGAGCAAAGAWWDSARSVATPSGSASRT